MALDLFLEGVPARRLSAALFEQLRGAMATGRLRPGDRLPPTRSLATELGIGRSTVTGVYARLVAEGYAIGRPGDGTIVSDLATAAASPVRAPTAHADDGDGSTAAVARAAIVADLRSGRNDRRLFPVVDWRRSVVSAMQGPPPSYGEAAGLTELRRAIVAWVGRSRGVDATPDEVLVTAGAQGAFDLVTRALLSDGVVAVENPGYVPARRALVAGGAEVTPVRVDGDGLVVDDVPRGVRAVYVTPSHQAPTGAVLGAARRRDLLELAADEDAIVIEDDYDTEFRFVDRPLEPLRRLDRANRVVYVGSFSKTITASLRIGFVVAGPEIIGQLLAARAAVDVQPPHLTQAGLAAFITAGHFERHLRRSRRHYRQRRDTVLERLRFWRNAGLISGHSPCPAGLHATIDLWPHLDPQRVASQLRAQGVVIETTEEYWLGDPRPGLVIGFGLSDESELVAGLDLLGQVLTAGRGS